MIEPSNKERLGLPDCSQEYMWDLEQRVEQLEVLNKKFTEVCKNLTKVCSKINVSDTQEMRDLLASAIVQAEDTIALAEKGE